MNLDSNIKIFSTGMMRTGGSLVMNIVSLTKNTHIFNERLNFFRFIDGYYNLYERNQIKLALEEFKLRLKYRSNIDFDSQIVFKKISAREYSGSAFFDEVYKYFLTPIGKSIWGEYANLNWRHIPSFLNIFPDGKIIVVIRDVRSILASFKALTFLPGNQYLNVIFNWIDFVNYINKFKSQFSYQQIHFVRLEELHTNPEQNVKKLVNFIGEKFSDNMLEPEKWPKLLNEKYDKVNVSAHTNKKVFGYDPSRNETWKNTLDLNDISLTELLAGTQLEDMGYELTINKQTLNRNKKYLFSLLNEDFLQENLIKFLNTGEGTDILPIDARLPENWSDPCNPFKKFVNTEKYSEYLSEIELCKSRILKN